MGALAEAAACYGSRHKPPRATAAAALGKSDAELAALIGKYSKTDGLNDTAIAPLHYFKMSMPSARMPVLYSASLCLVVQGEKELLENETYRYAASQFLIVSVDPPAMGHVTVATPEKPTCACNWISIPGN